MSFAEWAHSQVIHFNVLQFIAIVFFSTTMGKMNVTKLLKEQSQELYNEIEEIKDEIREKRK